MKNHPFILYFVAILLMGFAYTVLAFFGVPAFYKILSGSAFILSGFIIAEGKIFSKK